MSTFFVAQASFFFFSFFQIYLLLFGCKLHSAGLLVCFLGLEFEFSCFSS